MESTPLMKDEQPPPPTQPTRHRLLQATSKLLMLLLSILHPIHQSKLATHPNKLATHPNKLAILRSHQSQPAGTTTGSCHTHNCHHTARRGHTHHVHPGTQDLLIVGLLFILGYA
ncbi:hypothetical protein GBAR_LOCUS25504, partial [Geodia barretti]